MTANGKEHHERACCSTSEIVPIKRYPNRRFYDRRSSRYVTLQEIEGLVRDGQTIEVRDSRSDEDLTRVVLGQILLERQPERMELFPIPLLHFMLRANEISLDFLRVFMKLSLATLESLQAGRAVPPFATPFDWMRMFFPGLMPLAGSESRKAIANEPREVGVEARNVTPGPSSPEATIAQLVDRLAELEARLKHLETGSSPSSPGPEPRPGERSKSTRNTGEGSSK